MSYIILGLGISGLSTARYLHRLGEPFKVIDTREAPPLLPEFQKQFPSVPVYLGKPYREHLLEAKCIVLSPGLSPFLPELQAATLKGIPIISDVELFARVAKRPIIAITGTNAKGTVTTLVGKMIEKAGKTAYLGGNIGVACLDLLEKPLPDYYVLELSSFQLETTYSLRPFSACILNIAPDHLDRHGTLEHYISAKQRIYQNTELVIYNADDPATVPKMNKAMCLSFGEQGHFHLMTINEEVYLAKQGHPLVSTQIMKIHGRHNWMNALAALALVSPLQIETAAIESALKEFAGLSHRCQWVGERQGVKWFDDSKGTNVSATEAALKGLGNPTKQNIVLIAGGQAKGQDFSSLRPLVERFVKHSILLGQDAKLLETALDGATEISQVSSLAEAVQLADQIATSGDYVLLSPACASLDMFKDYHDRGQQFVALFKGLSQT